MDYKCPMCDEHFQNTFNLSSHLVEDHAQTYEGAAYIAQLIKQGTQVKQQNED